MVENASATKAPIAKIADKVSSVFVPTVMAIALVAGVAWLISGRPFSFALARAISVLSSAARAPSDLQLLLR